jgi:hypothetical protein
MEQHDLAAELAIPGAQELLTSATMTRLADLGLPRFLQDLAAEPALRP